MCELTWVGEWKENSRKDLENNLSLSGLRTKRMGYTEALLALLREAAVE